MLFQLTPSAMPEGYGEAVLPLAEAKAWARVLYDDEDTVLELLRDAAVDGVEQFTSLYLRPRAGIVATFAGSGRACGWGAGRWRRRGR